MRVYQFRHRRVDREYNPLCEFGTSQAGDTAVRGEEYACEHQFVQREALGRQLATA